MFTVFNVDGIECSGCAIAIKQALVKVGGVSEVCVDMSRKIVTVRHEQDVEPGTLVHALSEIGYGARLARQSHAPGTFGLSEGLGAGGMSIEHQKDAPGYLPGSLERDSDVQAAEKGIPTDSIRSGRHEFEPRSSVGYPHRQGRNERGGEGTLRGRSHR
jgi:copper chaperone CopZ